MIEGVFFERSPGLPLLIAGALNVPAFALMLAFSRMASQIRSRDPAMGHAG